MRAQIDPATGQPVAEVADTPVEEVATAVRAAGGVFETCRDLTPSERARVLLRLADLGEGHAKN